MRAQWPQPRLGGSHAVFSSTASLKSSRGDEAEIARDAASFCVDRGTRLHDNQWRGAATRLGKRDTPCAEQRPIDSAVAGRLLMLLVPGHKSPICMILPTGAICCPGLFCHGVEAPRSDNAGQHYWQTRGARPSSTVQNAARHCRFSALSVLALLVDRTTPPKCFCPVARSCGGTCAKAEAR